MYIYIFDLFKQIFIKYLFPILGIIKFYLIRFLNI